MINDNRQRFVISFLFFTGIFILLFIFYSLFHPYYIFDFDDWTYISYKRIATPVWGAWNPAKVFPEIIMPCCGYFAARVVYPVTGDFIKSLMLVFAFLISLFITVYSYMFYRLCVFRFRVRQIIAQCLTVLFLIYHFYIYCTGLQDNPYVFSSFSVCAAYNYTFPAILNGIIVLFLMCEEQNGELFSEKKYNLKNGFLILGIYFAVFSNLFHSVILISYIFGRLIQGFFNMKKKKYEFLKYIEENMIYISAMVLWIVSLIFEANGMRASQDKSKSLELIASIQMLFSWKNRINYIFMILSIFIILGALIVWFLKKNRDKTDALFINMLGCTVNCSVLCAAVLIILCSVVGARYLGGRCDVIVSVMIFIILIVFISAVYLISNFSVLILILPLLIVVLPTSYAAFHGEKGRIFSDCYRQDPAILYEIDKDIFNQIKTADESGKEELVIFVPESVSNYAEWYEPDKIGERISTSLYRLGIIRKKIRITVIIE